MKKKEEKAVEITPAAVEITPAQILQMVNDHLDYVMKGDIGLMITQNGVFVMLSDGLAKIELNEKGGKQ